jgi:hypothetical protein
VGVEQLFGLVRSAAAEPLVLLLLAALGVVVVAGLERVYRRRK